MNIPFALFFEFLCAFSATRFLYSKQNGWWRHFIWFLTIVFIIDTTGYLFYLSRINNHWLYNIANFIFASFYTWVLYKINSTNKLMKRLLTGCQIIFSITYLFESIQSHFLEASRFSFIFNTIYIIIACCLYFYFLLKNDEYINLVKDASFWIISGLFFFELGSISLIIFSSYLVEINLKENINVSFAILNVVNFIFYGCWTYAFICKYRQTISSPS